MRKRRDSLETAIADLVRNQMYLGDELIFDNQATLARRNSSSTAFYSWTLLNIKKRNPCNYFSWARYSADHLQPTSVNQHSTYVIKDSLTRLKHELAREQATSARLRKERDEARAKQVEQAKQVGTLRQIGDGC
ncbi:hypothetical protein FRC03_004499 [Tulasnella sp. 419]|nr:hypothetical protein FRC03_004499 [Tulasnella sp. 419]